MRNINSVVTIGGIDTLIFDKTGTLTKNELNVSSIFYDLEKPRLDVEKHNSDIVRMMLDDDFS